MRPAGELFGSGDAVHKLPGLPGCGSRVWLAPQRLSPAGFDCRARWERGCFVHNTLMDS